MKWGWAGRKELIFIFLSYTEFIGMVGRKVCKVSDMLHHTLLNLELSGGAEKKYSSPQSQLMTWK